MFTIKTSLVVILPIAAASLNAYAGDRQTNPLHPSYYAERVTLDLPVHAGTPYVDFRNPLHPTFARNDSEVEWIATKQGDVAPYVDTRNPLHPSYKKR